MNILKCFLPLSVFFFLPLVVEAQIPEDYYEAAEGKKNVALRLALQDIIDGHTSVGYGGLWEVYRTSDINEDGKVWDMYSSCNWTPGNRQCGNYKNVCDCYNREHSVPQSWFGERSPMVSDAFHIYPTDGKVNGQRSNYPFGECANGVKCDNNPKSLGRLGTSTFSGYTNVGKVFEPEDEYKGDFARTYFYMATRYADQNFTSGNGNKAFTYSSSSNPRCDLTAYSIALFLKWHRNDPVSEKETQRNAAIYSYQHNRNPFIDYPQLAEYIWGDSISYAFDPEMNIPNGIEKEQLIPLTVYTSEGRLHIENLYGGEIISIYNIYGQLLSQHFAGTETLSVILPDGKIFIVRIVDNSGKTTVYKLINSQ